MTNYQELAEDLAAMISGVPHLVANLSNASALIFHAMDDLNWAGFYLMEEGKLVLGPFQGRPACIEIAVGKGVCGTAVAADRLQLVPDVDAFPGHIPCDGASRSEIVLPLHANGRVVAVLDIDSPRLARFGEEDAAGLGLVAAVLERELAPLWQV